jgi:hypothetical protein
MVDCSSRLAQYQRMPTMGRGSRGGPSNVLPRLSSLSHWQSARTRHDELHPSRLNKTRAAHMIHHTIGQRTEAAVEMSQT